MDLLVFDGRVHLILTKTKREDQLEKDTHLQAGMLSGNRHSKEIKLALRFISEAKKSTAEQVLGRAQRKYEVICATVHSTLHLYFTVDN